MPSTASQYDPIPTPPRAFPAIKVPARIAAERQAGAYRMESLLDRIERMSLSNCEDLEAINDRLERQAAGEWRAD